MSVTTISARRSVVRRQCLHVAGFRRRSLPYRFPCPRGGGAWPAGGAQLRAAALACRDAPGAPRDRLRSRSLASVAAAAPRTGPSTLATCAPASDPRVVFPFSSPDQRSGRGAILWLGGAPQLRAWRGSRRHDARRRLAAFRRRAVGAAGDIAAAPAGRAARPTADRGGPGGGPNASGARPARCSARASPAARCGADRRSAAGRAGRDRRWLHRRRRRRQHGARRRATAIELREQRHYATRVRRAGELRDRFGPDHRADRRHGLPRRLDRAVGAGRRGLRALDHQRRAHVSDADARSGRLRRRSSPPCSPTTTTRS